MSGADTAGSPLPAAFLLRPGSARSAPPDDGAVAILVEARMLGGHRKEAVVYEGEGGPVWRLESDEGLALKGTDLSPFPLGYFNAGLHGDLHGQVARIAQRRGIAAPAIGSFVRNTYGLRGSFARGDGAADAAPSEIVVRLADPAAAPGLIDEAAAASPALAALRDPLAGTFALTLNGRRRPVVDLPAATGADLADPFMTWTTPPRPASEAGQHPLIRKTGQVERGEVIPAQASVDGRIVRTVAGTARSLDAPGLSETDAVLERPGSSHFALVSDGRPGGGSAPGGLSLLSAGIAFCLLTQMSRYVDTMRLDLGGLRLSQRMGFASREVGGGWEGRAEAPETHVFLNGGADAATAQNLLRIAARTCFLHATLADALPPTLRLEPES